jgi:GT2 family glycosyltransferase
VKKEPLISIGILNYNGLKYLKKIIPLMFKLDYSNYEIVVVDNNSSDKSLDYLNSLRSKKIRIIRNTKDSHVSRGKNICVKNCKGDYILLLDEDMKILDRKILGNLLNYYLKKRKIAFLAPLFRDRESNTTKYYGIYSSFYGLNVHRNKIEPKEISFEKEYKIGAYHGGAVFFEKKVWDELGGYSDIQKFTLNDFDLGFRAYILGYENYLYPLEEIVHIGKDKDINKERFAWKFKYYFSGISIMMWRDYNLKNLIVRFPVFFLYSIILYFSLMFFKKNLRMPFSLIVSWSIFLKNLPKILKERKDIQSKRVIKKDIFLKIKPPKFN